VSDGPSPSALRELRGQIGREIRAEFTRPLLWVVLVGIGTVLALAGAFGTGDVLRPVPLWLYWTALTCLGYAAGSLINAATRSALQGRPFALRVGVFTALTSVVVFALVVAVNTALFGLYLTGPGQWLRFAGTVFAVTLVIVVVLELAFDSPKAASNAPPAPTAPPLLDRLPFEKRGALLAVSVEDHYVQIQTTQGTEMLLMRLSDAIREVGATPGAQVHRSHWVAWAAVTAARREGERAILTLTSGAEIPVSRANIAKLKDQGLLPK
jgi:hypothetical protein